MIAGLKREKLKPSNIDYVFLTHYHLDHVLQASVFTKAKILDGTMIYEDDRETEYGETIPGTSIGVISTPGHADELASLLAQTEKGNIMIASDNFWWIKSERQEIDINKQDMFANNIERLKESRKKILKMADYVIPGHGKMMKV